MRSQRARWASCAPDGSLRFNWRVIQLPLASIDYVVVHSILEPHATGDARLSTMALDATEPRATDHLSGDQPDQRLSCPLHRAGVLSPRLPIVTDVALH